MTGTTRVEKVVRSAWERRLLVVAVERCAIAATVVLAALVMMLLVGTQVLDSRWLFLLAAVGLGIAAYQVRRSLIGHYRVAQILDRRLQLADSLSTAWFLLTRPGVPSREPVAEFQLHNAEQAAQTVDVSSAFPFTGRRPWLIVAALAILATTLFGLRYFVTRSLSIEHSLIPFQLADVFERNDKDSEEAQRQKAESNGSDQSRPQNNTAKNDAKKDAKDPTRPDQPPPTAPGDMQGPGQNPNQPAEMREAKQANDEQSKQSPDGAGSMQKAGEKQSDNQQDADAQKPSSDDAANSPKSSNGLIDRMKDALSSLAAKMRPPRQPKQPGSDQKAGDPKNGEQPDSAKDQNNPSQQASSNQEASEQTAQSSQGQAKEQSRAGQGRSADQSADRSKSESHSGVGSQDGDKSTKDAEQLKAMGKLAEIIGKRSASATGDVMVENPSGKQRLQTEYSQRVGNHSDLGGEINRDEIPLMYQQYVREYMSQVRRQAAKKHKASPSQAAPEEP